MSRGTTLVNLLDKLRIEAKLSINPAHNSQARDSQVARLQRVQEDLWEDFNWPHLRVERTIPLQSGQYKYEPPSDLKLEKIEKISVFDGGRWHEIVSGIDNDHYNAHNSALDERSWPPRRWRIYEVEEIEIWPVPDRNGDEDTLEGMLKLEGIRNLNPLVSDGHRADLDDRLLALFAAAEATTDDANAKRCSAQANRLYQKLRGGLMPRGTRRIFSLPGAVDTRHRFTPTYRPPGG